MPFRISGKPVVELDMTRVPVIVFWCATHGGINVVDRRSDGPIGWIDPPRIETRAH